jgi:acyl carrier protein phosphodiesterase
VNHLAHFQLAGAEHALIVGGFLGDFVKGRLPSEYDANIDRGIRLHRSIDAFTDQHSIVKQSQARFGPRLRRFAPVITDIVFDHFLARHWQHFSPLSLQKFSTEIYRIVLTNESTLPERATRLIKDMQQHRRLEKYSRREFVDSALLSLSKRITRTNPLYDGFEEFVTHYDALESDFLEFFPEVLAFSIQWQQSNPLIEQP